MDNCIAAFGQAGDIWCCLQVTTLCTTPPKRKRGCFYSLLVPVARSYLQDGCVLVVHPHRADALPRSSRRLAFSLGGRRQLHNPAPNQLPRQHLLQPGRRHQRPVSQPAGMVLRCALTTRTIVANYINHRQGSLCVCCIGGQGPVSEHGAHIAQAAMTSFYEDTKHE